ncbi:MAG: hypothetical protein R3D59_14070 [Paracoccaceae bacterium]
MLVALLDLLLLSVLIQERFVPDFVIAIALANPMQSFAAFGDLWFSTRGRALLGPSSYVILDHFGVTGYVAWAMGYLRCSGWCWRGHTGASRAGTWCSAPGLRRAPSIQASVAASSQVASPATVAMVRGAVDEDRGGQEVRCRGLRSVLPSPIRTGRVSTPICVGTAAQRWRPAA